MQLTASIPTQINVQFARICVPVDHEEEQIPGDFPGREGDTWRATIEMDTGIITDWQDDGLDRYLSLKVTDRGNYELWEADGSLIAERSDCYVPDLFPNRYGDYLNLYIKGNKITNWAPEEEDVQEFIENGEL